ncbi:TauD/TfdA dioxygenase family protein [Candidatus Poriferisocius sp.]|uniref:TauD/TfdA dioxygenase family protein n=1 Tax=Candidatus Poriferisocius sp. TaxID=3101276 RepID=UPI003B025FB0
MIRTEPIDAPLGALATGWNPGTPLSNDDLATLRQALADRLVVVLRGQRECDADELAALAHQLGEPFPADELYNIPTEVPEVLAVSNELNDGGHEIGTAGSGPLPWHTDYAFLDTIARESLLNAQRVPADGGADTSYCDMYTAHETLPSHLAEKLAGRIGHYTITSENNTRLRQNHHDEDPAATAARRRRANPDIVYPGSGEVVEHPVEMPHPDTGRVALYVSSFSCGFEGIDDPEEAFALTQAAMDHAIVPEHTYTHRWRQGDVVIFDTVGTVHRREMPHSPGPRSLRQLSIKYR